MFRELLLSGLQNVRVVPILLLLVLFAGTAHAANTINMTTLTIAGVPAGCNVPLQIQNPLGVYNTNNYQTTDWTTTLSIPYANAVITTYGGNVPYQFMGSGTTLTCKGTVYTINEIAGSGFTGFIMSNSRTTLLPFYAFYNASQWNATQANELMSIGVNSAVAMLIAHVSNVVNTAPYGTVQQTGINITAGNTLKYATYVNGTINFISTSVKQTSSNPCVNTNYGGPYCTNSTTPQPIPFIITPAMKAQGTYPLTVRLTASLAPGNQASFNYSIQDITTNTQLTAYTTLTSSQVNVVRNYNVPITDQVEIVFNAKPINGGAINYSKVIDDPVTYPTNSLYYFQMPITSGNTIAANTQILYTLNIGAMGKQYFANNCQNMQPFNAVTGATIAGVVESCPANTANVVKIWLKIPELYTSTDNNIYMAVLPIMTNNFNAGTNWGSMASNTFGHNALADNGNVVMIQYFNFDNNPIASQHGGTVTINTIASTPYGVGNALETTSDSPAPAIFTAYSSAYPTNFIVDSQVFSQSTASDFDIGAANSLHAYDGFMADGNSGGAGNMRFLKVAVTTLTATGGTGSYTPATANFWYGQEYQYLSGGVLNNYISTSNAIMPNYATANYFTTTDTSFASFNSVMFGWQAALTDFARVVVRAYPNNNVMPTIGTGTLTSTSTANQLIATPNPPTLSNTTIDVGQVSIANTVISAGSVYTSNWLWHNSNTLTLANTIMSTPVLSNNAMTLTINAFTSNSFLMTYNGVQYVANGVGVNTIIGVWTFNAYATDANGDTNPTPQLTNSITVNPQLIANVPTEVNTIVDLGQTSLLTSHASGGTPTLSYQWYTIAGASAPACTSTNSILGATLSTYTASPTTTNSYAYKVTDQATTNANVCSTGNTITEYPALTAVSIAPTTANNIAAGNTIVFSTAVTGGAPNYKYVWTISNSVTNTIVNTVTYSNVNIATNTFTFTTNTGLIGNMLVANVLVTDSATGPESMNSLLSGVQTIVQSTITQSAPALSFPNFPPDNIADHTFLITAQMVADGTLQATLLINGQSAGVFTNMIVVPETQPGTYVFQITTTGNALWASNTLSRTLNIFRAQTGSTGGGGGSAGYGSSTTIPTTTTVSPDPITRIINGTSTLKILSTGAICSGSGLQAQAICSAKELYGYKLGFTLQYSLYWWEIIAPAFFFLGLALRYKSHKKWYVSGVILPIVVLLPYGILLLLS